MRDLRDEGVEDQPHAVDQAGGVQEVEAAEEVDDLLADRQERDAWSEGYAAANACNQTHSARSSSMDWLLLRIPRSGYW